MKEKRFECCFENEEKGIFFEVDSASNHISITMFNRFEEETEVCLREDDVERLIGLLQSCINK